MTIDATLHLGQAYLTGARYEDTTKFPEGFDPRSHGMLFQAREPLLRP